MTRTGGILLGIGFLLMTSCSALEPNAGWVKPMPLAARQPHDRPPLVPEPLDTESSSPETAKQVIDLDRALHLALRHNAELKALARKVRALEYRRLQVSRWSNPSLDISAEDWVGSRDFQGFDQIQLTAQLSQELDIAGKHSARSNVLAQLRDEAGWAYELARLELYRRTALAFADVLVAQLRLEIIREEVDLAQQANAVFQLQVEAGRVTGMEVERTQIAVALAKLDLQAGHLQLDNARQALAACWGSTLADFVGVQQELIVESEAPGEEAMLAGLDDHPQIRMQQLRLQAEQARAEAERAEGLPDLSLTVGYRYLHGTGDSAMVAGLGLPLPVFDSRQDAVSAARQDWAAARDRVQATRSSLRESMLMAARRLVVARQAARVLAEAVLPQSQKTFASVKEGARIGRFGYLDLLDAQRTLSRVKRQALEARAEVFRSRLELEYHLAKPLANPGQGPLEGS